MKLIFWGKDGGPESNCHGLFLEIKRLFSIVLLRFDGASREAFHTHAFNSWSLLLKGQLVERHLNDHVEVHTAPKFIRTRRETFHKVSSCGRSWVLSFRGPWAAVWNEWTTQYGLTTLTFGRKVMK